MGSQFELSGSTRENAEELNQFDQYKLYGNSKSAGIKQILRDKYRGVSKGWVFACPVIIKIWISQPC